MPTKSKRILSRRFEFHDATADETFAVTIEPQTRNPERPGMARVDQTCDGLFEGSILLNRDGAQKLIHELDIAFGIAGGIHDLLREHGNAARAYLVTQGRKEAASYSDLDAIKRALLAVAAERTQDEAAGLRKAIALIEGLTLPERPVVDRHQEQICRAGILNVLRDELAKTEGSS